MKVNILKVFHETPDSVSLTLQLPRSVSYRAGQFVNVTVTIAGQPYTRAYSFSSAPGFDTTDRITIKKVEGGIVSSFLMHAKPGGQLEISEPMGGMLSDELLHEPIHWVMVAGGSGITPLYAILKYVLLNQPKSKISLVFANRDPDSVIFKQHIDALASIHAERFSVVHFLEHTTPDDKAIKGRPDMGKLLKWFTKFSISNKQLPVHYLICGPHGLMALANETLELMHIHADFIHTEYFSESLPKPASSSGKEVMLYIEQNMQRKPFVVNTGEYILNQLLMQAFDAPYSCGAASCGTCRVRVLQGEIEMDRNYILSESELHSGQRLLCKGKVVSDGTVITYD